MKYWIDCLLWKTDIRALALRIAEALREIAVLWLVFSILDELIAGKLTVRWLMTNIASCFVLWALGTYIEFRHGGVHR